MSLKRPNATHIYGLVAAGSSQISYEEKNIIVVDSYKER